MRRACAQDDTLNEGGAPSLKMTTEQTSARLRSVRHLKKVRPGAFRVETLAIMPYCGGGSFCRGATLSLLLAWVLDALLFMFAFDIDANSDWRYRGALTYPCI
jgi:hypothetical protein